MHLSEFEKFLAEGKNPTYRKIDNNTYVVKTMDIGGKDVIGIQLHNTVIAAVMSNGTYQFTDGGWPTMTTRDRLGKAFKIFGIDAQVSTCRKIQSVSMFNRNEKSEDNPRGFVHSFDFGEGFIFNPAIDGAIESKILTTCGDEPKTAIKYIFPNHLVSKVVNKANRKRKPGFAVR